MYFIVMSTSTKVSVNFKIYQLSYTRLEYYVVFFNRIMLRRERLNVRYAGALLRTTVGSIYSFLEGSR